MRHDKSDAYGRLERVCRDHGALIGDGFYQQETAKQLATMLERGKFSGVQFYMVAALVENVVRAVLNVDPNQTSIAAERECAAKAVILKSAGDPERPWAEAVSECGADGYYVNLYAAGHRETLADNCPRPEAQVLASALNAASKYLRRIAAPHDS